MVTGGGLRGGHVLRRRPQPVRTGLAHAIEVVAGVVDPVKVAEIEAIMREPGFCTCGRAGSNSQTAAIRKAAQMRRDRLALDKPAKS